MKEYTFTEARQNFATLLDEAKKEGIVRIRKKDGEAFYIKPEISKESPLDIEGVEVNISASEIVKIVREGRERDHS